MRAIFLCRPAGRAGIAWHLSLCALGASGMVCLFLSWPVSAQVPFEETAPRRYRVEFVNKDNNPYSLDAPASFLSEKSLSRRQRQGISLSFNDLPVTPSYIDSIRSAGAVVLTVSKWFNAVTIIAEKDSILELIAKLSFVRKNPVARTLPSVSPSSPVNEGMQTVNALQDFEYGASGWQTAIHKGQLLHSHGYTGQGMTIALIDAGFYHVDQLPAFASLWENSQILGTHDFVISGSNVFNGHSHGMVVLSIIGGYLPGELIGTAPDAHFWLLRSEDAGSEYMIEEDNWAAAAEFADSAGADIINTSLGYSHFDDSRMNHSYADMDGNTARISRAADIAASKGMLVVVSAGNLGAADWHYISAPADADSVLAVGAVDANGFVADFSSRGPSNDLRIKPDISAIGKGTWMADFVSGIRQGNGTSLSAPVITGLAACLWQAKPDATAMELIAAIKESSDRYTDPDNDYGYGIPDFNLADVLLSLHNSGQFAQDKITVFPNPFTSELYIIFSSAVDEKVDVSLTDQSGRVVFQELYPRFTGRDHISVNHGLSGLNTGVYILKVVTEKRIGISKLIKY
jgi:serine protease AprX